MGPETKPMPHTHTFNFFSFCAYGSYEHRYYRRQRLDSASGDDSHSIWYGASRPKSLTAEDRKNRTQPLETEGSELNFEVVLKDSHVHKPGFSYFIDHRVIHDVIGPA